MKAIFADTGYWIALINKRDELHEKAKAVSNSLGNCKIVTSEMVLNELLNRFGESGTKLRKAAVNIINRLRENPNATVVPMTSKLFREATEKYDSVSDKEWSLTDCASFIIMEEEQIEEALTHDKHFEQAGHKALLRAD